MPEPTEEKVRIAFSERLIAALEEKKLPTRSTHLAGVFNERFPELKATIQTVRKWLRAEAMPGQARMLALAKLIGVSAPWLRFGTGQKHDETAAAPSASPEASGSANLADLLPLMELLARLSPKDLQLIKKITEAVLEQHRD